MLASGEEITIEDTGLTQVTAALSEKSAANKRITRGAIIRVMQLEKKMGHRSTTGCRSSICFCQCGGWLYTFSNWRL
jgi:hypothetical protein